MANSPRKLTESPWFWVELFSYFALLALLVIGPKYARRQGVIEQRFKAKREIARQQYEGQSPADAVETGVARRVPSGWPVDGAREAEVADSAGQPLIVSLAPLFILLLAVLVAARVGRLWLSRRRDATEPS